jgi:Protein of unknown function (DUF3712)
LEDNDTPFLQFRIPAVKAVNGTETQIKQRVQIDHLDAFTEYTKTNLRSEEYTVHLRGKGGLKQGSLPHTTVHYNQKIKTKGMLRSKNCLHPLTMFQASTVLQA